MTPTAPPAAAPAGPCGPLGGRLDRRGWWCVLFLIAAAGAAHLPLLVAHAGRLWSAPHYQFFPAVLVGAVVLARARLRDVDDLDRPRAGWSALLWTGALAALAVAVLMPSPWIASVAGLGFLWAAGYLLGGRRLVTALLPIWLFLWLLVPPPLSLDTKLIFGMQQAATRWASGVLDLLSVSHVPAGNVLEVPGRRLLVEEACSGINSLFAAMTCMLLYLLWVRRGAVSIAVLLGCAVFWVLLANCCRVVAVVVLATRWDLPVTDGWGHEVLGGLVFVGSVALIMSTERLLTFFVPVGWKLRLRSRTRKESKRAETRRSAAAQAAPGQRAGPRLTLCVAGLYLVLFAVQLPVLGRALGDERDERTADARAAGESHGPGEDSLFSEESLPGAWRGWRRGAFEAGDLTLELRFANSSRRWMYDIGNATVEASIHYPFTGWHELSRCFEGQGWEVVSREVKEFSLEEGGAAGEFVALEVRKGMDRFAYVLFALLDERWRPLPPPMTSGTVVLEKRIARLRERLGGLLRRIDVQEASVDSQTWQIQVVIEGYVPISDSQRSDAEAFFHLMHERLDPRVPTSPETGDESRPTRTQEAAP